MGPENMGRAEEDNTLPKRKLRIRSFEKMAAEKGLPGEPIPRELLENFNEEMKKHGEQAKRNRKRAIINAGKVKITF